MTTIQASRFTSRIDVDRDFGAEAHAAAAKHLEAIAAAHDYEEYGDYYHDTDEAPEWPEDMAGPWCACDTCTIRETLHAAWPILRAGAIADLREQVTQWAMANELTAPPLDWATLGAILNEETQEADR